MVVIDMVVTRHIVSSDVMSLRISEGGRPSRLDATLAVSESTCVEIVGEPTNKGAVRCVLVEVCPSAYMTILVSMKTLPGNRVVPVEFVSAGIYIEASKKRLDFVGGSWGEPLLSR